MGAEHNHGDMKGKKLGIYLQKYFASGEGPHSPMSFQTMDEELNLLKRTGLSFIALGGHDSSDEVIEYFNSKFGDGYHHVKVGDWIRVTD